MAISVEDIVLYQNQYWQVVATYNNGRLLDLKSNRERINQVYASDCEKVNK
ncbi:MAG: hypothetical protein VKK42_19590 [Lyngbya sp.]|nr:hypothetical protein [Lyngbya sp.]